MKKSQRIKGEFSQYSQSQRSNLGETSQSQRYNRGETSLSQKTREKDMTEEQLEAAVQNVTAFLLCDMRIKRKLRKEDIVTNALNKSAKQYGVIMKRVKDILAGVFGLILAKLPGNDTDVFIIVNKHRAVFEELTLEMSSEEEIQDNMILTVVLSSIFMNRGQMFESHVLTILDTIGFLNDSFYGSTRSGKMKDCVTKLVKNVFVKQLYLEAQSIPRPEKAVNPPLPETDKKVTVFQWGYRALLEVDVDKIVDYIVKIHDGKKIPAFPSGYCKELKIKQTAIRAQVFGA